jgi:serine/threonine protein kinase
VLIDFGIACYAHEELSLSNKCGTPGYIDPAVLDGAPYDLMKSDIFSVGSIFYFLLTGGRALVRGTTVKDII